MNGQNRLVYLVRRMVLRFFSDGIPQAAAALSYFLLFSLLPLLMFVNALVARLGISIEDFRPVFELMPKSLQELILSYFEQITATPSFSPLLIGTLLTLYFLSRAVRSIMRTVDGIYRVEVHRRAVLDILLSFAMTAGFLLTVVCSFVLAVAGRMLLRLLPQALPIPAPVLEAARGTGFCCSTASSRTCISGSARSGRGRCFRWWHGCSCHGAFRSMWTIWRGIPCFTARSRRSSCS